MQNDNTVFLFFRKGFNITWIQRKIKRSGEKEGLFHKERDQGKFQSELAGKKGRRLSWPTNWCEQRQKGRKLNWRLGV